MFSSFWVREHSLRSEVAIPIGVELLEDAAGFDILASTRCTIQ